MFAYFQQDFVGIFAEPFPPLYYLAPGTLREGCLRGTYMYSWQPPNARLLLSIVGFRFPSSCNRDMWSLRLVLWGV